MIEVQQLLSRYQYDPLDRLAGLLPMGSARSLFFYREGYLVTQTHGAVHRSLLRTEEHVLAQQQDADASTPAVLLATDMQRSVLHMTSDGQHQAQAYSVYGHYLAAATFHSLLGFAGEPRDPLTGHYLLGSGYRAFNPQLMRFNSPDDLSPFFEGGINAYAYCSDDPVNHRDPTGHVGFSIRELLLRPRQVVGDTQRVSIRMPVSSRAGSQTGASAQHVSVIRHTRDYNDNAALPGASGSRPASPTPVSTPGASGSSSYTSTGSTIDLRSIKPYHEIPLGNGRFVKRYNQSDLNRVSLQQYKSHLDENLNAILSFGQSKKGKGTEKLIKVKLVQQQYLLEQYEGRKGIGLTPRQLASNKSNIRMRIKKLNSDLVAIRRS